VFKDVKFVFFLPSFRTSITKSQFKFEREGGAADLHSVSDKLAQRGEEQTAELNR